MSLLGPSSLLLALLAALAAAQTQLYLNHDAVTGDHVYHAFTDPNTVTLYLSLDAYHCAPDVCAAGQCIHPYCASSGQNCTSGNEIFSATTGPLSFSFACCSGSALSTCSVGGSITISTVHGLANYTGQNGACAPLRSAEAASGLWDFSATIPRAAIQTQCGAASTGWIPLISPIPVNQVPGGTSHVQVQLAGSNNLIDPMWFSAAVAIVTGSSSPPAIAPSTTYLNGPSSNGLYYPGYSCGAAAQIAPPPVCPTTSSCSGSCGCTYVSMLNRSLDLNGCGAGCPTTEFWFQVCLLCSSSYSFLAICVEPQGNSSTYDLGSGTGQLSGIYQGSLCDYTITNGGLKTNQGCPAAGWTANNCTWGAGKCELFPVTVTGAAADYTFSFSMHDGQGLSYQSVDLNSGTCSFGSCQGSDVLTAPNNFGSCSCPICGDGIVEGAEQCDGSACCDNATCQFQSQWSSCVSSLNCTTSYCDGHGNCVANLSIVSTCCGDGMVDGWAGEECDGSVCCDNTTCKFLSQGTSCTSSVACTTSFCSASGSCVPDLSLVSTCCGDGVVDKLAGELCDDPSQSNPCCNSTTCYWLPVDTVCGAGAECILADTCQWASPDSLQCLPDPLPNGTLCASATDACHQGHCLSGTCLPMQLADNTTCTPPDSGSQSISQCASTVCQSGTCQVVPNQSVQNLACTEIPAATCQTPICSGISCVLSAAAAQGQNCSSAQNPTQCQIATCDANGACLVSNVPDNTSCTLSSTTLSPCQQTLCVGGQCLVQGLGQGQDCTPTDPTPDCDPTVPGNYQCETAGADSACVPVCTIARVSSGTSGGSSTGSSTGSARAGSATSTTASAGVIVGATIGSLVAAGLALGLAAWLYRRMRQNQPVPVQSGSSAESGAAVINDNPAFVSAHEEVANPVYD